MVLGSKNMNYVYQLFSSFTLLHHRMEYVNTTGVSVRDMILLLQGLIRLQWHTQAGITVLPSVNGACPSDSVWLTVLMLIHYSMATVWIDFLQTCRAPRLKLYKGVSSVSSSSQTQTGQRTQTNSCSSVVTSDAYTWNFREREISFQKAQTVSPLGEAWEDKTRRPPAKRGWNSGREGWVRREEKW